MSLAYPIMRGGAPMIVALAAGAIFAETMSLAGWAGVGLISAGILSMAALGGGSSRAGLGFAVMNACVIAAYTLTDGLGVRRSGAAVGYTLWIFLLTAPPIVGIAVWRRGAGLLARTAVRWREGVIGGLGTIIAYGVALWAMTLAPVAMVAALRETSILFATAISALVLGEAVGWRRVVAVLIIASGAAVLRLA
jgi:drug/metabolite transporter (DMT)-like permease